MNDDKCEFCKGTGKEPGEPGCVWCHNTGTKEGQALLTPPAQQNQGEPVALPSRLPVRMPEGRNLPKGYAEAWNACLTEIEKLGPLYTHADPGEIERLREQLRVIRSSCPNHCEVTGSVAGTAQNYIGELEQKLAEAQALLRRAERALRKTTGFYANRDQCCSEHIQLVIDLAKANEPSASAEPGGLVSNVSIHTKSNKAPKNCNFIVRQDELVESRSIDACAEPGARICTHPEGCNQCSWCGFKSESADPSAPVDRDERAEFEKHYASMNDGFVPSFFGGEYDWHDAQPCWKTWQARAALEKKS